MSVEDIKKRFVNEIKLRGYDDKYIDRNEEREILQIAIQLGINIDSARNALCQVCGDSDYVLESTVLKLVREHLDTAAGDDGVIDEAEFNAVFAFAKQAFAGKKNDRQIKMMIVNVMEDSGNTKVKKGWFSDWYKAMKKDLGMG
jgi:thymidine phosphorylase